MRKLRFLIASWLLILGAPQLALGETDPQAKQAPDPPICRIIETAAEANALPLDFLVRLIWQESHFRPDAVGPLTSSGQHAQGIAQFMPATAAARRLVEPFDPVEALPKSGEFLAELRDQFGNLGFAAAAYNAGPQRVREFVAGLRGLPAETRNYVLAITGRPVEDWLTPTKEASEDPLYVDRAPTSCRDLLAVLRQQASAPFFSESQQRRVPSWCKHLSHPNTHVCGTVHQEPPPFAGKLQQRGVPSWCNHLSHPNTNVCGTVHQTVLATTTSSRVRPRGHVLALRALSR